MINTWKQLHITEICSTSNIIFHSYNIIIGLEKVRRQKIHASILVNINIRVQVGELTWKLWHYILQWLRYWIQTCAV